MTYAEIMASIEGEQKKFKNNLQINAILSYKIGELIGTAINDPKKYPKNPKVAFEGMGIFDNTTEVPTKQQDWQIMRDRISRYNNLRKQNKGRGENN